MGTAALLGDHFELRRHFLLIYFYLFFKSKSLNLFYFSFLGISIIADIFMCAIEKITSATKKIRIAGPGGEDDDIIEVPIWNGTVANLTLMALGQFLTC